MTRESHYSLGANRLLLRPQEAAEALGVSLRTIMAWVKTDEVPFVRLGDRSLRFPLDILRAWVGERDHLAHRTGSRGWRTGRGGGRTANEHRTVGSPNRFKAAGSCVPTRSTPWAFF